MRKKGAVCRSLLYPEKTAIIGVGFIVWLWWGIRALREMTPARIALQPLSALLFLLVLYIALGAMILGGFIHAFLCRAVIDERGVRVRVSRKKTGGMRWRQVRSVCVLHTQTYTRRRLIYISRIPNLWDNPEALGRIQPPRILIRLPYSRRCMAAIRRHYPGRIVPLYLPPDALAAGGNFQTAQTFREKPERKGRERTPETYRFLLFWPAAAFCGIGGVVWAWLCIAGLGLTREDFRAGGYGFFFLAIFLLLLGSCVYLCLCRITIDRRGVRSRIPGKKGGSGFIRWRDAQAVGVFRTAQGERLLFVSRIPNVWVGRNMMFNSLPLNALIKMGYSRKRLAVIRRHYRGEIVELE